MNLLQKKVWITWSKLRFLRLPIEKRVQLEVEQDGRHLTFLLVSLYEAGYGVQVVNSPWVFRELICLRNSAPMPFVIGGKEREFGISITDKSDFNHRGHREHREVRRIQLDYDYFFGLTSELQSKVSHGGAAIAEVGGKQGNHTLADGRLLVRLPQGNPKGEMSGSERVKTHEITRNEEAGLRLASQAGSAFSNPSTSKLARDSENTSLSRSAIGPTFSLDTSHSPLVTTQRAPYFMHPSVYHRGLHKEPSPDTSLATRHSPPVTRHSAKGASHQLPATSYSPQRQRRFRIGFFGTHDREFYTAHYHFAGMNRFEILEVFLQKYGNRMTHLRGLPGDWDPCEIAVSIDARGGDRSGKTFLSQDHYFEALRECDFVLSPPGWCMPVSHNLIEAMFCGAIPITNGGAFMAEPLEDGRDCLGFFGEADLVTAIEKALSMSDQEIEKMREAVLKFYDKNLDPRVFGGIIGKAEPDRVLVNAEEKSVPWGRDYQTGVSEFMAKFC